MVARNSVTSQLVQQTFLAAGAALMLAFGAFMYLIDRQEVRRAEAKIDSVLQSAGALSTWSVGVWLQSRIDHVREAEQIFDRLDSHDRLVDMVNDHALDSFFDLNYVALTDGTFAISPMPDLPADYDPRERPWYTLAMERDSLVLTNPYFPRDDSQRPLLTVAVPITTPAGETIGVFGGDFYSDHLNALLSDHHLGDLGQFFLVDHRGEIIAHPDNTNIGRTMYDETGEDVPLERAPRMVTMDGARLLLSFQRIQTLTMVDWYVAVAVDPKVAYADVRGFRIYSGIATAITLVLLFSVLGFAVDRLLARPLERARAQSQAANDAKSAFLANMSHEIRTPLNAVLGLATSLKSSPLDDGQRHQVKLIIDSGEALLNILNDIIDLSKVEAGKIELETIDFSLNALVESVEASFALRAVEKGLSLRTQISNAGTADFVGDPTRIRQILINLVSNAIKFTKTGEVIIDVAVVDNTVTPNGAAMVSFSVIDTGPGIHPGAQERLFSSFTQADATVTRHHGGAGLGLSISKQLCQIMNGEMSLTSTVGRGSAFTFVLPLARSVLKNAESQIGEARAEDALLPPIEILVAEDNLTNQVVVKSLLKSHPVALTFVDNGSEAVRAWSEGRFDVILMDAQMPIMNGVEAAEHIRTLEMETGGGGPRIPIIALTANAMSHQIKEYLDAGMDRVVAKPIRVNELVAAIFAVVDRRGGGDSPEPAERTDVALNAPQA